MAFTPSVYQQGIYDFITKGQGNAVVSAVAGSGKTTTLLNALKLIPTNKTILFLAFNKSIAKELSDKVPNTPNIHVKTVHGFGFSSLRDYRVDVFAQKYIKILNDVFEFLRTENLDLIKSYKFSTDDMKSIYQMEVDWEGEKIEKQGYLRRVLQLCDLGRMNLIDMSDADKGLEQLNEIATKHSVELQNGECFRAWHLIKLGTSFIEKMDFTDMIYMPIALNVRVRQYDYVFIDECQDLNACQRTLMLGAIKPKTGRFVAVGDPAQAIYGFAGADANSFKTLTELPKTIQLPLSVCYRCGKDIIAEAQKIIPHIEAFEGAGNGAVEHDKELSHIKDGDMVLCRQTYPLVRLCLIFLSQGKKARIMGGDIGASLIKNIEDTKRKREDWTLETMFNRLYADLEKVLQTIMRKEKLDESDAKETRTYDMAKEKISVIEMLAIGCDFPKDVVDKIKNIFNDESTGGILLSTVHKSKGLESDRVFIIHPELMPSKYAKMDWEIEQESNLKYVAYTRAKDLLAFIPKSKFDAWKDSENESKSAEVKTISESNWVGVVDTKEPLELEVVFMREITNHWGTNKVFRYELKDSVGNLFVKLGLISERFLDEGDEITIGSKVRFNAVVKEHQEFRGEKITFLSTLAKY